MEMDVKRVSQVILSSCLLLFLIGCFPGHITPRGKIVKVAILPEYSLRFMSEKYTPLWDYLSEETGYRIEPVSAISYSVFLSALEGAKAHISFQNGLFYSILAKTKGAKPIVEALTEEGSDSSRGLIITRADSPISAIADLKGKTIMVPSKRAVLGYLAQLVLCNQKGLNPEKDLTIVLGRRHDEVVFKVYGGKVDAGFVKEATLKTVANLVDISKIRILARTEPFPNWCFTSFPQTDKEVVQKIKAALLKLNPNDPKHAAILSGMGVGSFVEVSDKQYNSIRRAMDILRIPY